MVSRDALLGAYRLMSDCSAHGFLERVLLRAICEKLTEQKHGGEFISRVLDTADEPAISNF